MSNRRRLKRPSLPGCPDCDPDLHVSLLADGVHVDLRHDPTCPALRGILPMPGLTWAREQAAAGREVHYTRREAAAS